MKTIEIIATYEDNGRDVYAVEVPETFTETKEKLAEYLSRPSNMRSDGKLVKLSLCFSSRKDCPQWAIDCNGKIYF